MKQTCAMMLWLVVAATGLRAQAFFEGIVTYRTETSGSATDYREYHKNGNVLTDMPSAGVKTLYSHEERSLTAMGRGAAPAGRSQMVVGATVSREEVIVDAHRCLEVCYDTVVDGVGMSTVDWVDTQYTVVYNSGRVAEVPYGLVVRREATFRVAGMPPMSTVTRMVRIEECSLEDTLFER